MTVSSEAEQVFSQTKNGDFSEAFSRLTQILSEVESFQLLTFLKDFQRRIERKILVWNSPKIQVKSFNASRLLDRLKKINRNADISPEHQQQRLKEFLYYDMWTFMEEFVLKKFQGTTTYEVTNTVTSGGYEDGLNTICKNLVDIFRKEKATLTRSQVEQIVYGQILPLWMKKGKLDAELIISSPPGTVEEGYAGKDSYSMVFHYHFRSDSTEKDRTVEMTWYRRWMTLDDHQEFLRQLGNKNTFRKNIQAIHIIAQPTPLSSEMTKEKVESLLEKYKNTRQKKEKQAEIDEEIFRAEFDHLFHQFYFPIISQFTEKEANQKNIQKMEMALSFVVRRLKKFIEDKNHLTQGDTKEMRRLFEEQVAVQIDKTKKLTKKERDLHIGALGGLLGNLNFFSGTLFCSTASFVSLNNLGANNSLLNQNAMLRANGIIPGGKDGCMTCPRCQHISLNPNICSNCSYGRGQPLVHSPQSLGVNSKSTRNDILKASLIKPTKPHSEGGIRLLPSDRKIVSANSLFQLGPKSHSSVNELLRLAA